MAISVPEKTNGDPSDAQVYDAETAFWVHKERTGIFKGAMRAALRAAEGAEHGEPPSSENAYTGTPLSEVIRSEQDEPSDAMTGAAYTAVHSGANSMTPEQIATTTLGNWVKDVTDDRTVTQIIVQAIELDRAASRSLAAYQQISDAQERLSAAVNESRWPCGCRYSFYELTHPDEGHVDGDHRPAGA